MHRVQLAAEAHAQIVLTGTLGDAARQSRTVLLDYAIMYTISLLAVHGSKACQKTAFFKFMS